MTVAVPFNLLALTFLSFAPGGSAIQFSRSNGSTQKASGTPARPHILFVLADDLGWHDVGYMGSDIPTPTIDSLAGKGIKLTNYYVHPTCAPTRASLLTGFNPLYHGVIEPWGNEIKFNMPPEHQTFVELLRDSGYETHAVGKWHVGYWRKEFTPTFRGFNSFYGFYGRSEDYWFHTCKGEDGVTLAYDFRREEHPFCDKECSIVEDVKGQYGITLLNDRAKKIVYEHDTSRPLFLYFAWQSVHSPVTQHCPEHDVYYGERDPDFACMLTMSDRGLSEVFHALEDKQMIANTIIIFSTDNGGPISTLEKSEDDVGSSNWPLRGGKHTLFEGGMRAVGFVWMGWRNFGSKYDGLMTVEDWFPTLLSLANIDVPGGISGRNQFMAMTAGLDSPQDHILTVQWLPPTPVNVAVRHGRWKLIQGLPGPKSLGWSGPLGTNLTNGGDADFYGFSSQSTLLYDLSVDEEERHDLSSQLPDVLNMFREYISWYDLETIKQYVDVSHQDKIFPVTTNLGLTWGPED